MVGTPFILGGDEGGDGGERGRCMLQRLEAIVGGASKALALAPTNRAAKRSMCDQKMHSSVNLNANVLLVLC